MKKKILLSLFALTLSIISNTTFGQIDTTYVTAQKKIENAQKIPISLSVLNANEIEKLQLNNIKDIKSIVPNFFSADPGDGRNVTSIRGIATTSYDPTIAVNIDGVNQFNLDTYIPELFDIERILGTSCW